jgi:mRNA interferase MazF
LVRRGELYRVWRATGNDPRASRVYVIVSRPEIIESRYSTVICAPVYSSYAGLASQVPIGPDEGLKHESCIQCDALVSIEKARLSDYIGPLGREKLAALNQALRVALELDQA